MLFFERLDGLIAQLVIAEGTYGKRTVAELACMIGKVSRCAAKLLAVGQHVPKGFAQSDNILFGVVGSSGKPHPMPLSKREGSSMHC